MENGSYAIHSTNKVEFRQISLKKRDALADREEKSKRIIDNLISLKEYRSSKVISTYISFGSEVSTRELIKDTIKDKTICVPLIGKDMVFVKLKSTSFDEKKFYPLPKDYELCVSVPDLIFVPGVAFSISKHRLGFGKGYYDRYLSKCKSLKIGLCFESQLFSEIPHEKHDIKMDMIITEKRLIR